MRTAPWLLALALPACSDAPPAAPPAVVDPPTACADLSGSWHVVEQIDRSGCDEPDETVEIDGVFVQDGCTASLRALGVSFDGVVDGSTARLEGSYADLGAVTKKLTLTRDGDALTGTATWTWALKGVYACSGTSEVRATLR